MSDTEHDSDDVFKGHAVEKGFIRFTSVTQITMADDLLGGDMTGCLRKWFFSYVAGKKLQKTGALLKGGDFAVQLYHYLTTGQPTLSKTLEAAQKLFPKPGPDLECEQRFATGKKGADILKAIALRELLHGRAASNPVALPGGADATQLPASWPDLVLAEIKKFAGLTIRGIPVDGAADFRHRRGEYVDEDWIIKKEPRGIVVCETGDLKTMSRIHPEIIRSGEHAGEVIPTFAKTSAEVCADTQMISYGVYSLDKYPDVTHARLSHIIANKKKREAVKRTGLVPADLVRERFRRIENVVAEMEQVAQATNVADVRPNIRACDSYSHVDPTDPTGKTILRGCGHRYYCPLSTAQIGPALLGVVEEKAMSLFDQLDANQLPPAPPAPPAPLSDAEYQAQVAAERAKLVGTPPPPPAPPAPPSPPVQQQLTGVGCGAPGCGIGCAPGWVKGETVGGFVRCAFCKLADTQFVKMDTSLFSAPPPPPPSSFGPITPPDEPKTDPTDRVSLVELAEPLPPDEIAKVEDPVLRAQLEEHARQCAEKAAKEAAEKAAQGGGSVWCTKSPEKIAVTLEDVMEKGKKYVCGCGKSWTYKALKPVKEGEGHYAVIPKHKPVNEEQPQVAPPPPPAPPAPQNGHVTPSPPPAASLNVKFVPDPVFREKMVRFIDATEDLLQFLKKNLSA